MFHKWESADDRLIRVQLRRRLSFEDSREEPFVAARKAYEQAGVTPRDIDVAAVHDATSFVKYLKPR